MRLYRDPTGDAAVTAATRNQRHTMPATVTQLRDRLHLAVQADDGHGARLLTARLVRATA